MPYRAVLCDDEVSIVNELKEAIDWKELGIELVGAATRGKEALELILRTQPDLAVMDIRMPELTGLEIISEVRKAKINTDFLILSGYNEFAYAKEAIRLGAKAYLLKPLNISELYDEVCRICSSRSGNTSANRQYIKKLSSNFLRNLISGRILNQNSLDAMLFNAGLPIRDTDSFCVVLSYEEPLGEQLNLNIQHQLETLFSHQTCVFFKFNSTQIVGIFNTDTEDPMIKAMMIIDCLKQDRQPLPYIGIGDTVHNLIQSPYSYSRAITSITYRLYGGDNRIYSWQMICTVSPIKKFSDIDYLPLVQHIVRHSIEGIRTFCDQFLNELLYVPMPAPNYVFSSCFALYQMMEKEFSSYSHEDLQNMASPQGLYKLNSLDEIKNWLITSFTHLSDYIDAVYGYGDTSQKSEKHSFPDDPIIQTALQYIQNHILENPKIEDIAREVHLSASYFAIYFKKKTDMNLRDYMLQKKMEHARASLLLPDTQVTELAYQLGYSDYRSFSRAFKNVNGITPSDFQAKYRH
jgi:two-component system response regulator YesN